MNFGGTILLKKMADKNNTRTRFGHDLHCKGRWCPFEEMGIIDCVFYQAYKEAAASGMTIKNLHDGPCSDPNIYVRCVVEPPKKTK